MNNDLLPNNILYTVPEVAKIIKTNEDYVHKLRRAGLLKFIKLGSYKIRHETLEQFLSDYEGCDVTDPLNIKYLQETSITRINT